MANFPGPYEIEFLLSGWTAPARTHVIRVNVIALSNPPAGTLATAIDIQKQGGGTAKLNVVANQLWDFLRQSYHSSITCVGYTLWKYVTGTYAKDFISSGNVTNTAGSSATTPTIAWEVVTTYRSANGGIMKIVMIEPSLTGETKTTLIPNAAGTAIPKLAAYVLSADNVCVSRDDGFIVAALRDSRGQNERIWRKIYRS